MFRSNIHVVHSRPMSLIVYAKLPHYTESQSNIHTKYVYTAVDSGEVVGVDHINSTPPIGNK